MHTRNNISEQATKQALLYRIPMNTVASSTSPRPDAPAPHHHLGRTTSSPQPNKQPISTHPSRNADLTYSATVSTSTPYHVSFTTQGDSEHPTTHHIILARYPAGLRQAQNRMPICLSVPEYAFTHCALHRHFTSVTGEYLVSEEKRTHLLSLCALPGEFYLFYISPHPAVTCDKLIALTWFSIQRDKSKKVMNRWRFS